jgi:hypothetical protein
LARRFSIFKCRKSLVERHQIGGAPRLDNGQHLDGLGQGGGIVGALHEALGNLGWLQKVCCPQEECHLQCDGALSAAWREPVWHSTAAYPARYARPSSATTDLKTSTESTSTESARPCSEADVSNAAARTKVTATSRLIASSLEERAHGK